MLSAKRLSFYRIAQRSIYSKAFINDQKKVTCPLLGQRIYSPRSSHSYHQLLFDIGGNHEYLYQNDYTQI